MVQTVRRFLIRIFRFEASLGTSSSLVLLVHGLWMHGITMVYHRRRLVLAGFKAVSYSYPSLRLSLDTNAANLAQFARDFDAPRIDWVGHSLGGLIILCALSRAVDLPPGRVVLVGTPYRGSRAAETLERNRFGSQLLGRSIKDWLAGPKPSDFGKREIGVIAGSVGIGLGRLVAPDLSTPNDGAVTVEETGVPTMRERVVLPITHTGMLLSRAVSWQIEAFLRGGHFDRMKSE